MIDKQIAFDTVNLFRLTERDLRKEMSAINANLTGAERHKKRLEKLSKKILKRSGGENLFTDMVQEKILHMEVNIREIKFQRDLNTAMMVLLADYDYEELMELEGASGFNSNTSGVTWTTL